MPTSVQPPPHVCPRHGTGLSPSARARSKIWSFLKRHHAQAHGSSCWDWPPTEVCNTKMSIIPYEKFMYTVSFNACFAFRRTTSRNQVYESQKMASGTVLCSQKIIMSEVKLCDESSRRICRKKSASMSGRTFPLAGTGQHDKPVNA